ncbi:MAG: peptidylprolyl isomerase, partial [Halieaceae bacterium]
FNAEDLSGPAAELELSVENSAQVLRNQPAGLFANPRLIAAAFSSDVLNEGYNSEVIEIESEHFVVLRIREHALPAAKPLQDVQASILATLRDQVAGEAIRAQARLFLQQLREGASIEELALAADYRWQVELGATRDSRAVPAESLRRAFELPAPVEGESEFEFVENGTGDIELFELVRVTPVDTAVLDELQRQQINAEMVGENGRRTDEYYQQQLRSVAEISRS